MLNGCCVKGCPGKQTGTQQGNNLEKSFDQAILILGRRESYLAHLLPRSRCPGNPPVPGLRSLLAGSRDTCNREICMDCGTYFRQCGVTDEKTSRGRTHTAAFCSRSP